MLALAEDAKGCLYIGAGGGGNIYRLTPEEERSARPVASPSIFYKTAAQHIMALAIDSDGALLAGAAPEGILYRITPEGRGKVLYDARDNAIMAIATQNSPQNHGVAGTAGDVYVATGPRGSIYAVHPDGSASILYDHAPLFFTALKTASDGSLFASTAGAIYHITPPRAGDTSSAIVVPLDNTKDVDYLCLAVMPNGAVAAGTGNVGEVFLSSSAAHGSMTKGTYESVVRDAKLPSHWGTIRWEGAIPVGAAIRVSTRSGNVEEPDEAWSALVSCPLRNWGRK